MKVLIAGLGSVGQRHLRNLLSAGVTDIIAYRRRGLPVPEVDHHGIPVYEDLEAALDQRPHVVFVTNPTSQHIEVALAAAERGCDLFIEKPLSHDLARVDDLIRLTAEKQLVAMVGCNFRFHTGLLQVREYLQARSVGRAITARAHAGEYLPDWHPGEDWRAGYSARRDLGGGVILTVIHELDYLSWMFGAVSRVFAMSGTWSSLGTEVEDAAEILVEFADGVHASIHLDYVQRPRTRTLEVIAEGGTIRWDFYAGRLSVYDAATATWTESAAPGFNERNTMYQDELRHFLACVVARRQTAVPLEEGKRVLEAALAARHSGVTGLPVTFQHTGVHAAGA
jgi:predicted dehydrogenase